MQEQETAEKMYADWVQRVQYLEKLLEDLEGNMENVNALRTQLNELKTVKGDEEILVPVANGIFVEAKLKNATILKVNVGKGIMVDKTIPETLELIEKQEREIAMTKEQVMMKLEELYEMAKQY
jgi:prefoldin alpha subunit